MRERKRTPGTLRVFGGIPSELLAEIEMHIIHPDFQPALVEVATKKGGYIETDDVLSELDRQLIADGGSENDYHPARQRMSNLYQENRGSVKKMIDEFMPDKGEENKGKYNRIIALLNAIQANLRG